ncbi:MAG TPA: hypothetical protein VF658_00525 [Pyrinomonadaceae bacterium]|jgi:hypothetical protein
MRAKNFALTLVIFSLVLVASATAYASTRPEALARAAVSENPSESRAAIAELRALGPAGLQTLFAIHADEIKRNTGANTPAASAKDNESWKRLSAALDAVSQQYDSAASGLYWYTDFEQARTEARKQGKPILSLRLLGNLSEEFSCANSRFFRTVLYSNPHIAKMLGERFILHWKSVRPVPRVTIDYGDGRKLERTLTGNSIHYILDAEGRPLDALPGLYGPQAFMRELEQAESVFKQLATQTNAQRTETLRAFHQTRLDAITQAWKADVQKVGGKIPTEIVETEQIDGETPSARAAARRAMSKAVTEVSIINSITYEPRLLEAATDNATWNKIAALHSADAKLDQASIALMRRQTIKTLNAEGADTAAQALAPDQLARLVQNFERYIALDTVRNEYLMHTKLHAWLTSLRYSNNLEGLNERVYSELFLTPRNDPWLGLFSPDTYTALENSGVKSN